MKKRPRAKSADEFTRMILGVFAVNGALLIAGDRLTAPIGLTSARWQVLGTIFDSPVPMTVAGIARSIGSSRQNIRIIVRELEAAGMVTFAENPSHQRASLVMMTKKGESATGSAQTLQLPFAESLAKGVSSEELGACADVLEAMLARLRVYNDANSSTVGSKNGIRKMK